MALNLQRLFARSNIAVNGYNVILSNEKIAYAT